MTAASNGNSDRIGEYARTVGEQFLYDLLGEAARIDDRFVQDGDLIADLDAVDLGHAGRLTLLDGLGIAVLQQRDVVLDHALAAAVIIALPVPVPHIAVERDVGL